MGLEPTASGVTGRRYNQLNYDPVCDLSLSNPDFQAPRGPNQGNFDALVKSRHTGENRCPVFL